MGSLKLTRHAVDKLATYAIEGARLTSWRFLVGESALGGDFQPEWQQGRYDLPDR